MYTKNSRVGTATNIKMMMSCIPIVVNAELASVPHVVLAGVCKMRMWMLNPKLPCKKHLCGEHFEIHLHRHNFVKQHSIKGRLYPVVQIEPESMKARHDALALEMVRRGYKHNSPYEMPDLSHLAPNERYARVDLETSYEDLISRCEECRQRAEEMNDERRASLFE